MFADGPNSESKKILRPPQKRVLEGPLACQGARQRQRRGTPGALKLEEAEQQQ